MASQTWRHHLQQDAPAFTPAQDTSACALSPRVAQLSSPVSSSTIGSCSPIRNNVNKLHARRKGSAPDLDALRKRLSGASLQSASSTSSQPTSAYQSSPLSNILASPSMPADVSQSSDIAAMTVQRCVASFFDSQPLQVQQSYETASRDPLISVKTLGELEIDSVVNNGRLRHDINFDRELHFRPNLDGNKGRDKQAQSQAYWSAVELELSFCMHMFSNTECQQFRWTSQWASEFRRILVRLPGLFASVRRILDTLVPDDDQKRLHDMLDVAFIMQEIERGTFDLQRLSKSLVGLLTAHCAPMRDVWISRMASLLSSGSSSGAPSQIVEGMKQLFLILEAMKLDVANHQIRFLRPRLLDNTIQFEQNYFQRRMSLNQLDMERTYRWYCSHDTGILVPRAQRLQYFVSEAIAALFSQPSNIPAHKVFPESFRLDFDRIDAIQRLINNHILTAVCIEALRSLLAHLDTSSMVTEKLVQKSRSAISTIIGSNVSQSRWQAKLPNIAAELIRLVLAEDQTKAATGECAELAGELEHWLRSNFESQSANFSSKSEESRALIESLVYDLVCENLSNSPHMICESMLGARPNASKFGSGVSTGDMKKYFAFAEAGGSIAKRHQGGIAEDVQDVSKRIAHILVLHWRVWAPLLDNYERESAPSTPSRDTSPCEDGGCPSPCSSHRTASPSPLLQASRAEAEPLRVPWQID